MKKLAILVYPEFSVQEVSNTMYLFRWYYDTKTVIVGSTRDIVISEEGVHIKPEITVDEFNKENYYALVLPGISDFRPVLNDTKLLDFLKSLKDESEFVIGAICAGPLLLSLSGILDDKKFTNSLWKQMNEEFKCININNLEYAPLVIDGNVITAIGSATRLFALEIGKLSGLEYYPNGLREATFENYKKDEQTNELSEEQLIEVRKEFKVLL